MPYTAADGVQVPSGTDAFSPPVQFKTWADKAATYNSRLIVASLTDRDNLTGMLNGWKCYVTADSSEWLWNGTAWVMVGVSKPYRALLWRQPGMNIPNSAITPVVWTDEYYDVQGMHATGATTLVAPIAGVWLVTYQLDVSTTTVSSAAWVACSNAGAYRFGTSEGVLKNHTGSAFVPMLAGDTVLLNVFQASGGPVAVGTSAAQSTFGMSWVSVY